MKFGELLQKFLDARDWVKREEQLGDQSVEWCDTYGWGQSRAHLALARAKADLDAWDVNRIQVTCCCGNPD